MSKYVENNLGKNEVLVKKATLNPLSLVMSWVFGILFFWLLFIPLIRAISATIRYCNIELAITNKRIIGKVGFLDSSAMDAPLNKIQNVSVQSPLWGKVFNYGTIRIDTAAGSYTFDSIKKADAFKGVIMAQIDQAEEDRVKQQAEEMAKAMAGVINKS